MGSSSRGDLCRSTSSVVHCTSTCDLRRSSARSCCSSCRHLRGTCASRHLCCTGSCCHLCGTSRFVHRSCACGDLCGTSTSDRRGTCTRGDIQVSSYCQCQSGLHQVDRSI